jgi:hypothetical protein
MLALVAGVERYVARDEAKFTTVGRAAWKRSAECVPMAAASAVAVFGDSLVKHGVLPRVLARHGLTSWNLAVPKGMFPGHDLLLRRLLRSGARPSAILVDGHCLNEKPFQSDHVAIWLETTNLLEAAELAWASRDPEFTARMALARALPTLKARPEVRLKIRAALDGASSADLQGFSATWRNWNANRGAFVFPDRDLPPGPDPVTAALRDPGYRPGRLERDPVNAAYVDRFLGRAAAHGIPVFWLLPPFHPEMEDHRERSGWYPEYASYLRRLQEKYPNLTVVDGRGSGYPPAALFDMTHLSRTGAIAYSDALGRLLRDRLAGPPRPPGPRWVRLPRYDPAEVRALASASSSDVEDITQSHVAFWMIANGPPPLAVGAPADGERRQR